VLRIWKNALENLCDCSGEMALFFSLALFLNGKEDLFASSLGILKWFPKKRILGHLDCIAVWLPELER
jgi:hypothetical protein